MDSDNNKVVVHLDCDSDEDKKKKKLNLTRIFSRVNNSKKLQKSAKKLGAKSLDYSKRKNIKFFVALEKGNKFHFGSPLYKDYLVHCDEERRKKYLARAKNIKLKQKGRTYLYQFRISKLLESEYSLVKKLIMK